MLTYKELKDVVADLVQRANDTTFLSSVGTWINLSLLTLYNSYDYWLELKNVHNFTTVDGTATYYMPNDFNKPMRFYDITNDSEITIKTEEEYFDSNIANIADAIESDADTAFFTEVVGVKKQVSSSNGDTVIVVSSDADDKDTVTLEGYLDSGLTIIGYETLTLNGTTNVTGSTTFYKLLNFSKSADTDGYVTLKNSTGTTLATLSQYDRVARYKAFRLGLIPNDSTTSMRVLYKRNLRKLVNDNDYPFAECDDYLIFNSVCLALQRDKETLDRAVMMQNMAQKAFVEILNNQMTVLGPNYQQKYISDLAQAHRA